MGAVVKYFNDAIVFLLFSHSTHTKYKDELINKAGKIFSQADVTAIIVQIPDEARDGFGGACSEIVAQKKPDCRKIAEF